MAVVARIRTLTRPSRRLEAIAKNAIPAIRREMELHLEAAVDYLSIDKHKLDSNYTPTYRYQQGWEASPVRETGSGLIGTVSNDVVDDRGRHYAAFVGGTETEPSDQVGDWLGDWNQVVDAVRGVPGLPTFRQKIGKVIHRLVEDS